MSTSPLRFSSEFFFGSAISAYQAEGETGTRHGDWDEYLARRKYQIIRPGEIGPQWWKKGEAERDLKTMANLNLTMQRIGIEWARIEPDEGIINQEALARYREILDEMKRLGISPMLTLSHYVLPDWVAKQGGWLNGKTVQSFLRFVRIVLAEFPETTYWLIVNEPAVLLTAGFVLGYFPPFGRNMFSYFRARRNLMKAMTEGYALIKSVNTTSQVGNAFSFAWMRPHAHDSWLELALTGATNYLLNTNYIDTTHTAMDFLGVNFYTGYYIEFHPGKLGFSVQKDASVMRASLPLSIAIRPPAYRSDWSWPIVPDFFLHLLKTMQNRYNKPIFVTENGIADREDTYRSFYILTHLTAMWRAIELGVDIRGYLYWSSIDNLEWNEGYQKRFGLIALNHFTGARTVRKSAKMLAEIAKNKRIDLEDLIPRYIPTAQQETAYRITDQLLHDPRKHHARCTYR
ncbi:glycoside hydrolase family 1 protein [Candidatus Microgenomates bacterium]|nr:glycoside hydrolase family 1 protein [Candidatus Microgenomates bacterium]